MSQNIIEDEEDPDLCSKKIEYIGDNIQVSDQILAILLPDSMQIPPELVTKITKSGHPQVRIFYDEDDVDAATEEHFRKSKSKGRTDVGDCGPYFGNYLEK